MSLIEKEPIMKFIEDGLNNKHYGYVGVEIITEIEYAPALDVAPVEHDEGINTSFVSVKDVDEWQDRIILDEGDKSKRCKVYYAESPSLIAKLEEKIAKQDELLAVLGVRIPEDGDPHDRP